MKILLVDDDEMTHQLVTAVIRILGDLEVEQSYRADDALARARRSPPDLIISDINMPDMDGLALCKQLRGEPGLERVPILLLTARGETHDRYEGFLHGADDYLVKPFDVMEIQLRIKALLRRSPRAHEEARRGGSAAITAGRFHLDRARLTASVAGTEVRFTATEFAILEQMAVNLDSLVTAEALLTGALGYPRGVGNPQTIHSHMRNIRSKFRQAQVDPTFLTSSHQGYMLASREDQA
ncbi:MAG: phoB [Cyanobacteria bacterium RYN_339]|nr:phoB [Cyanobacteria bacterium RYN_339]